MKILFVGDLNKYGRSYYRYRTLVELGHSVDAFSHTFVSADQEIAPPSLLYRMTWRFGFPIDPVNVNKKICHAVVANNYDVVWIEKGNTILPTTLKFIRKNLKNCKIISCSEDDMYARHSHSYWYKSGLKNYDIVFTTKTYNISELKLFGAQNVQLFFDSYDEKTHLPLELSAAEKDRFSCGVSAIGAYEPERASSLLYLAENDIRVTVWGNGWSGLKDVNSNLIIKDEFLFGGDYAKAICASHININFLRKVNRDEITSRSIEIPACRSFMLAERTTRHLDFFVEGSEAEFFASDSELLLKVEYYLVHDQKRAQIARRGYERCLSSGYSMREQLGLMLAQAAN